MYVDAFAYVYVQKPLCVCVCVFVAVYVSSIEASYPNVVLIATHTFPVFPSTVCVDMYVYICIGRYV